MATKVRDVMTTRPRCVTPDTPVSQVAELMEAEDVGSIPVLDGDPRGMPVSEIWSRELVTVDPGKNLSDALQLMAQYQVRRIPVIDEAEHLVGVVSQADIALEAREKTTGELVEEISRPPEGPRTD
jgi:CBS domain-containing protein